MRLSSSQKLLLQVVIQIVLLLTGVEDLPEPETWLETLEIGAIATLVYAKKSFYTRPGQRLADTGLRQQTQR